ncbi:MAG: putative zinc metalloprotease [Candidatus Scalindua rubra]|uniref:Putative zinc metalloprotease n=1 Tax=Candidatus Scalindua rubra TaxID=1872076 RepID=A0A1E3XB64_9BACT|nr:MAG: putative zinc metalloprotease [Candidatus Scalindua rubra]
MSEKKEGLKIVGAQSGSPGYDAGLRTGDIVLEIEGKKIKSLKDYVEISRKSKNKKVEIPLTILREGVLYDVTIKVYSIPVYQYWELKVTKPIALPRGLTSSPYEYWVDKGNRTLKKTQKQSTL